MRKLSIYQILIVLFIFFKGYSQNNKSELPTYAPVSPEAANLGKYGDTPINLATGKLQFNVPFYTIKMNGYELPIYLNYAYDGFMPEQDPGLVGLGWNLVAGGMVTRKKLGKSDDQVNHSSPSLYDIVEKYYFNTANNEEIERLINVYINNTDDTQPDRFYVNIGNMNANFSYDKNGNPIFYPNKNYIINQTIGFDANFEITDDKGIKYIFADTETTSIDPGQSLTQVEEDYISTWKISQIILPKSNDKIQFSYYTTLPNCTDCLDYEKTFESLTKNIVLKQIGSGSCLEYIRPEKDVTYNQTTSYTEQISIKRINFPEGHIEFDIQPITTAGSKAKNKQYLNSISIYDNFDKLLTKYDFVYEDQSHRTNYNLLKQIKKTGYTNSPTGKEEPFYKFEYYGKLPEQANIYAGDLWGYYNGNTSNRGGFYDNMNVDFYSTRLGALKKIYFPTGGFNVLEYEQNAIHLSDDSLLEGGLCASNLLNLQKTLFVKGHNLSSTESHKEDSIYIGTTQIVKISLNAMATPGAPNTASASVQFNGQYECDTQNTYCNDMCHTSISVDSDEMPTEQTVDDFINAHTTGNGTTTDNIQGTSQETTSYFKVYAGTTIRLICDAGAGSKFSAANVTVDYWDGIENELKVGGIRISKVKVYDTENNITYQNQYIYKNEDGLTSSGKLVSFPKYKWKIFKVAKVYDDDYGSADICSIDIQHKAKNSKIPLAGFDGSPVIYRRVEKITTDANNNEKDKEVSRYTAFTNPSNEVPFLPLNPKNWRKAKLTEKEVFKKENGSYHKIASQSNRYRIKIPFSINVKKSIGFGAMKVIYFKVVGGTMQGDSDMISYYNKDTYIDYPEYYLMTNSTEFNFFDNGTLTNTITNEYDLTTGYLKKTTTHNSRGEILTTENFYPYEATTISSLGNTDLTAEQLSAYNMLTNDNIIQTPVQTVTEINQQTTQIRRTTYQENGSIALPQAEHLAKAGLDLEERIVYQSFDAYGNPTEISKKNGTHIFYIWGYEHQKVIAKIVNPPYDSPIFNSNIINAIITKSDEDNDNIINQPAGTEYDLWLSLENLRASLPEDSKMTFYTYDPVIGLTSVTQPNGDIQYYVYDEMGRLQKILDKNKNIIKEYEYHFKPFPVEFDDMYIDVIAHDEINSTVTFQVINPNGIPADYQWEVQPGQSIINGQGTDTIEVSYQCRPELLFGVSCVVSDTTYPAINTTLEYNFLWDGCLSDADLNVEINYNGTPSANPGVGDDNTGDDTVDITLDSIQLSVVNLTGGVGNLTYQWYYVINGFEVLFDTTTVGQNEISTSQNTQTFNDIQGNLVSFKCKITDNTTQQEVEAYESQYGHYILPID